MTLKTNGPRFNPHLLNVPLYIGGKSIDEIKVQFGFEEVVKLASNESPIGPSPLAVEAARQMLSEAHRYPGITELALRRKLAACLDAGLDEGNIVIGNGGTDILRLITQAFVFAGGNTIMCRATFPMYHIFTTMFGGTPRAVDPLPDYQHNLAAMAAQIDDDTRLIYLCSPNNPTGDIITQPEADEFLMGVPDHVVVIFDESYADFVTDPAYPDTLAYVKEGRNVLVVRSFSKYAGLANLRIGYVIGRTELADYLQRTQSPFHTGAIALAAAAASLDDTAYHAQHREVVLAEQAYLYTALGELGLKYLSSQSNFVTFVDPPLAPTTLAEQLLWQGIIVRPVAGFGLPNGIRVTVGTHEENVKFIEALRTILIAQVAFEKAF